MLLLLVSISFLLSLAATQAVAKAAGRLNFYDFPSSKLKSHAEPVPYSGTAIWLVFVAVMLGLRFFTSFETGTLYRLRGILIGGTVIYILGLLDDFWDLDFRVKFLWQVIAAGFLIYYGVYIKFFPGTVLNVAVSIFWVVLVVNAINIIDILDGLSVGVAAISALGFFLVSLPTEKLYVNFAALALFGILGGFWVFNRPPARVFMGDAGSLFTGFVLASLSMGADYSNLNIIGLFAPILILGIPVYDTLLVVYFRWRKGLPVFKGSRDHYALRLSMAGFSPWKIDLISYLICAVLSLSAFLITVLPGVYAFALLALVMLLAFTGSGVLGSIDTDQHS